MKQVHRVDPRHIHALWPRLEHLIEPVVPHNAGDWTLSQAQMLMADGTWTTYIVTDVHNVIQGVGAVSFETRPNARVALVVLTGGYQLFTDPDVVAQFHAHLRREGATQIEGAQREAVARLWRRNGAREKYRIMVYDL